MIDFVMRRREDLIAGLVTAGLGIYILSEAFGFRMGTLRSMGPGYFPMLLGVAMCTLGALLVLLSEPESGDAPAQDKPKWRGVILVTAAFLAFAFLIERAGLVPAILAAVFLSSMGNKGTSPLIALALAVGTAGVSWLIFSVLLGLQIKAFA